MAKAKEINRGVIRLLYALSVLPGIIGCVLVVKLWLSIIPDNPRGSEISPFILPTMAMIYKVATLVVGIPVAIVLGLIGRSKFIVAAGLVASFLPFLAGSITFYAILWIMDYTLK